jgi:hypothetical protein
MPKVVMVKQRVRQPDQPLSKLLMQLSVQTGIIMNTGNQCPINGRPLLGSDIGMGTAATMNSAIIALIAPFYTGIPRIN